MAHHDWSDRSDRSLIPSDPEDSEEEEEEQEQQEQKTRYEAMIPSDDEDVDTRKRAPDFATDYAPCPDELRASGKRQCTIAECIGRERHKPSTIPADGYLVVDLFASIGGVSCAAAQLNHTVVLACDMDEDRLAVHACNFPDAVQLCMQLGPETEERLVATIHKLVPPDQWHRLWIHCSPPCQAQSGMHRIASRANMLSTACLKSVEKNEGLDTVEWALNLIARLEPPQFSFEEVSDNQSCVEKLLENLRRQNSKLIDFEVLSCAHFGVPQHRPRMIATRPSTMRALRHSRNVRVKRTVTVRDVVDAEHIPKGAVSVHGPKNKAPRPGRARRCRDTPGKWTDGFSFWYELDYRGPTVSTELCRWLNSDFEVIGSTDAHFHARMMTFPDVFTWPDGATLTDKRAGYANAVPPAMMRAIFRAASAHI